MPAADNSPPTKTSGRNPVDESVEAQPNGDATPMPCVGQEPFNDATTPENPYLLPSTVDTHSAIDISGSDHPHEFHHQVPEQWEVRAPDTYEMQCSGLTGRTPSSTRTCAFFIDGS
ncbi:hypothetical protein DQ04_11221000 [Trypanosoma grayi]|uniref:hypothetical protein n=1 Tax=Trypanosoma grayi TaxID=71804 RepID=UPI0004F49968|nr:hypothetical protein DQ04_11221000 [Trypanosoma grayi]KEG07018.1 hypothetical protein DQ04_11221000 [Trypanosoma grayi]